MQIEYKLNSSRAYRFENAVSTNEDEVVEAECDHEHESGHFGDGEDDGHAGGELDAHAVDRREHHCAGILVRWVLRVHRAEGEEQLASSRRTEHEQRDELLQRLGHRAVAEEGLQEVLGEDERVARVGHRAHRHEYDPERQEREQRAQRLLDVDVLAACKATPRNTI